MKLEHKSLIFKAGDTVGNIGKALIIPHLFAVNRSQTTTAKSTEKKRKQNKRNQTCSNHKHRELTSKLLCLFSLSSHRLRGKYTVSCTFCKKYEAIPRTGPGLCFLRSFFLQYLGWNTTRGNLSLPLASACWNTHCEGRSSQGCQQPDVSNFQQSP